MRSAEYEWSSDVFGQADLKDARRTRRLVQMAARAAAHPNGRISETFDTVQEREGAYDFLENPKLPTREIGLAAFRATAISAAEQDVVFIPIDGTSIKLWDGVGNKDFGRIGTHARGATGLKVIGAMAVDSAGMPIGLCGQHWWSRPRKKIPKRPNKRRRTNEKETQHWVTVIKETHAAFQENAPNTRCWYQLDREADAWPILLELAATGQWFTVRSSHDRRLNGDGRPKYLRKTLMNEPVRGVYDFDVPERKGRKARRARMTARTARVSLLLKDKKSKRTNLFTVNAVLVREEGTTPRGEKPIQWLLLTNHPSTSKQALKRVVFGYTLRWRIEDFHRTWKSGWCDVEQTQLRSMRAVVRWATILAMVATRVERLKHASRTSPDVPATVELNADEVTALVLMKRKRARRGEKISSNPTVGEATIWIAELGGYTGNSSGGPPGSITIARGLERVLNAAEVVSMLGKATK